MMRISGFNVNASTLTEEKVKRIRFVASPGLESTSQCPSDGGRSLRVDIPEEYRIVE